MSARLIMDSDPVRLHPTDTIGIAAERIMQRRYRSLPVVDDEGRFLGVVSVNCLLLLVLPKAATMAKGVDNVSYITVTLAELNARLRKSSDEPVSICLKEDVKVVHPETPLLETLLTLYQERKNLPVVNKKTGRLEGMISYYDVGEKIMAADS